MDVLNGLAQGFAQALQPANLLAAFVGCVLGTLIGVLPGIGPTAGIALLIPITAGMDATAAIIMLSGIYYGSMYGGSTTAILINTPGEAASMITALDGFQLARQGRAGVALGMAALASFIAGTVGLVGLMLLAPPLANFALSFGPPEYFALMLLGLSIVVSLAGRSLLKGLMCAVFGLLVATIGIDPQAGVSRFSFGNPSLMGGVDFISVAVGLFAITEVLQGMEQKAVSFIEAKLTGLWPGRSDWREARGAVARGSLIGFLIGLLPGAGPTVASVIAYDVEKKVSRHPERFGRGAIAGVAAPEGANNAAASAGMIPLLTLGIPGSAALAVLLGALLVHGLRPGPLLFQQNPDFVWAVIASMYVGNATLLLLNLPLVGWWARLTRVPFPILGPLVLVFCFVGTYSVRNSLFDAWVALFFGILGYVMRKLDFPAVPVALAVILGPLLETALRQTLTISQGRLDILLTRPTALALLVAAAGSVVLSLYGRVRQTRLVTSGVLGTDED